MRRILVKVHRYAGLSVAIFLTVSALTGSVIAFNEELDSALNPDLYRVGISSTAASALPAASAAARAVNAASAVPAVSAVRAPGVRLTPDVDWLVRQVEQTLPNARVSYIPLDIAPGESLRLRVEPRGTTELAFDEVFADPATGRVLGTRRWGACCFGHRELLPFLYQTHYTLQLPGTWGLWLMGSVAILWFADCLVGLALTLPRAGPFWRNWGKSWRIKRGAARPRYNFDLHRAGGLWFWVVLLTLALSGVALNLPEQVFRPVVSLFSTLKPDVEEIAARRVESAAGSSLPSTTVSWSGAVALAQAAAARRGWSIRPKYAYRLSAHHVYGIAFSRTDETFAGLGPSFFYFDDRDGTLLDSDIMGSGSAGDIFLQAQYPLHSGRIAGTAGRILISICGLVVPVLAWTGIYLWLRKKRVAA